MPVAIVPDCNAEDGEIDSVKCGEVPSMEYSALF
jgi:hypothetical protein